MQICSAMTGESVCLFRHDTTLVSVFLLTVTKTDYAHLPEMLGDRLFHAMRWFLDDCS